MFGGVEAALMTCFDGVREQEVLLLSYQKTLTDIFPGVGCDGK